MTSSSKSSPKSTGKENSSDSYKYTKEVPADVDKYYGDTKYFDIQKMQIVKDTPFISVQTENEKGEHKYFLAVGRFSLTDAIYNSHEECHKKAHQVDYDTILKLITLMIEGMIKREALIQPITKSENQTSVQ